MALVELRLCVVGYGKSRVVLVVEKGQVYVSIVYAFVFHPIAELEIEVDGVVVPGGCGIIGVVEGRNVKILDVARGFGGA